MQNLVYALIQIVHNFGAVAIVGLAASGVWRPYAIGLVERQLALWLAVAWAVQAMAGAAFGAASFTFYGQLPDIHGVALAALGVKVICTVLGFILALRHLLRRRGGTNAAQHLFWKSSFVLSVIALSGAAFLRWFS